MPKRVAWISSQRRERLPVEFRGKYFRANNHLPSAAAIGKYSLLPFQPASAFFALDRSPMISKFECYAAVLNFTAAA